MWLRNLPFAHGGCSPRRPVFQLSNNQLAILVDLSASPSLARMRVNAQRAAAVVSSIVLGSITANTGKSPRLGNISPSSAIISGSAVLRRFVYGRVCGSEEDAAQDGEMHEEEVEPLAPKPPSS